MPLDWAATQGNLGNTLLVLGHDLAVGIALSVLDSAIANIALPAIAKEIHASPAASIWVINAYQLAVVISLLPLASLGDIFGYRRIYMIGLVVFTGAALVSALSHSLPMLTLGRALQGLGAFWACRRKEGCSDSSREVPRAANHQ